MPRGYLSPYPRQYRGVNIWPRNVYGMWSAYVNGRFIAADTLEGMKAFIRYEIGIGR